TARKPPAPGGSGQRICPNLPAVILRGCRSHSRSRVERELADEEVDDESPAPHEVQPKDAVDRRARRQRMAQHPEIWSLAAQRFHPGNDDLRKDLDSAAGGDADAPSVARRIMASED